MDLSSIEEELQKISSKEELQVGYEYGIVFNADINGKIGEQPNEMQHNYIVKITGNSVNPKILEKYNIRAKAAAGKDSSGGCIPGRTDSGNS